MDYRLLQGGADRDTVAGRSRRGSVAKTTICRNYDIEIKGKQVNTIRSTFMVILFFALGAVVAQAQMVMVYVSGTSHTDDYLLSAVEAGVMDVFFNAGIIVFNAGTYERVGDSDVQRRYWVRNTARQGGATHAIEVEVDLASASANSVVPEAASYRFVRVEPAEVLGSGRVSADRPASNATRAADQIGFQMGAEIARSALSRL